MSLNSKFSIDYQVNIDQNQTNIKFYRKSHRHLTSYQNYNFNPFQPLSTFTFMIADFKAVFVYTFISGSVMFYSEKCNKSITLSLFKF